MIVDNVGGIEDPCGGVDTPKVNGGPKEDVDIGESCLLVERNCSGGRYEEDRRVCPSCGGSSDRESYFQR